MVRWTLNSLAEGKIIYPTTDLTPWGLQKAAEMQCTFVRAQFPGSIEVVTLHNNTDIAYTVELSPEKPSLYSRTKISSICLC